MQPHEPFCKAFASVSDIRRPGVSTRSDALRPCLASVCWVLFETNGMRRIQEIIVQLCIFSLKKLLSPTIAELSAKTKVSFSRLSHNTEAEFLP